MSTLQAFILVAILHIAVGSIQLNGCLESINVCETNSAIFSCSVPGDEMEWGNSASDSDMRIRFRDDDPVGTRVQLANVVGVLTRRDQSGIASTYTLSISPGVQYGNVRIYCEDRERGGEKFCPTIAFTPGFPPRPNNLISGGTQANSVTIHWSPGSFEVPVTSYSVTVTPAPVGGACSGGTCSVSHDTCPTTTCSLTITHLQYGLTYSITVRSVNCRGESDIVGPLIVNIPSTVTTSPSLISTSSSPSSSSSSSALSLSSLSSSSSTAKTTAAAAPLPPPPTTTATITTSTASTTTASVKKVKPGNTYSIASPFLSDFTSCTHHVEIQPTPVDILLSSDTRTLTATTRVDQTVIPITTRDPSSGNGSQEGLPIQWILLAVLVPLSIIITAVLTLILVWCYSLRKARQPQKTHLQKTQLHKIQLQLPESNLTADIFKKQQTEVGRMSDHIYALPAPCVGRDSTSSMFFNMAYQQSFTMSSNAAYSSSLKV